MKVVNPMEEERDLVVFSDDEGDEFELEIVDYFEHDGQEYAVLIDPNDDGCECEDEACECEHDTEVYIMKIVVDGEFEEFLPVEDDKLDELTKIVEARFENFDEDDDDDEDETEED